MIDCMLMSVPRAWVSKLFPLVAEGVYIYIYNVSATSFKDV